MQQPSSLQANSIGAPDFLLKKIFLLVGCLNFTLFSEKITFFFFHNLGGIVITDICIHESKLNMMAADKITEMKSQKIEDGL